MMKKYFWMIIGIIVMINTNTILVQAEGGGKDWRGARGINRVIQAQGLYKAVGATVSLSFDLPLNNQGGLLNPYNDKPSAYLGGNGDAGQSFTATLPNGNTVSIHSGQNVEIDGGLQFETQEFFGVNPGWSAFISVNGGWTSPKILVPNTNTPAPNDGSWKAWRKGEWGVPRTGKHTGSIQKSLTFQENTDGSISLTISGEGTFYWNQESVGNDNPKGTAMAPYVPYKVLTNDGFYPKRVVAMTRSNVHDELDGSTMSCTYSQAWIGSSGNGWPDVSQGDTGYDAPGNPTNSETLLDLPLKSWDARWPWDEGASSMKAPTSKTIVEFPDNDPDNPPDAGAFNFAYRMGGSNHGDSGRYISETVNINARRATKLKGKEIEW